MSEARQRTLDVLEALVDLLVQPREHLPLSSRTDERSQQLAESLAREFGLLPPLPIEDDMATVTYSIGTSSRDYSTIAAWEADLDNGALYSSGDVAKGEMYNDSVFDELVTLNGGSTVGLASTTLTAAAGESHDGTAGTGVKWHYTGGNYFFLLTWYGSVGGEVSNIEFTQGTVADAQGAVNVTNTTNQKNILRNLAYSFTRAAFIIVFNDTAKATIANNIIYDFEQRAGTGNSYGIQMNSGAVDASINNTVYNGQQNSTGNMYGIGFLDRADDTVKNNIVADIIDGGSGGTVQCYNLTSPANAVVSHNLSSDATASGTGSLTSKTAANQFVSIVGGSEDLHLKTGADAIDAGTDLGTTPTGVNIDIDGRDRDLEGDTWDMGADEFVSAGGSSNGAAAYYYSLMNAITLRQ